jgi:hypothetical protein
VVPALGRKNPFSARDPRYTAPEIMREHLETLVRLLRQSGDDTFVESVASAATAPHSQLNVFLASNDLWGGSGSIADCAGGQAF